MWLLLIGLASSQTAAPTYLAASNAPAPTDAVFWTRSDSTPCERFTVQTTVVDDGYPASTMPEPVTFSEVRLEATRWVLSQDDATASAWHWYRTLLDCQDGLGHPAIDARAAELVRLIESSRWTELYGLFDVEHSDAQHSMYFEDTGEDPDDAVAFERFLHGYLREALGLGDVSNHIDSLAKVRKAQVTRVDFPYGADGPAKVHLMFETDDGPRTGFVLLDPVSLTFFNAVG